MLTKPTIQKCDGRQGRYPHCDQPRYIVCKSRMQCNTCSEAYKRELKKQKGKPVGGIKKMSDKKKAHMTESQKYYKWAIAANILKNGTKCCCDNCTTEIKNALYSKGHHVSHIIGSGANQSLYHNPLNHFILCDECEKIFSDTGKRSTMKIYPLYQERHELLNREYYERN